MMVQDGKVIGKPNKDTSRLLETMKWYEEVVNNDL